MEDSGQDEADEDDDLRSLFEEDTEDTPNEETGSQQAKGDTSDVKADPSVPEPAPEISPLGECFMCGKSLNGLDESVGCSTGILPCLIFLITDSCFL